MDWDDHIIVLDGELRISPLTSLDDILQWRLRKTRLIMNQEDFDDIIKWTQQ